MVIAVSSLHNPVPCDERLPLSELSLSLYHMKHNLYYTCSVYLFNNALVTFLSMLYQSKKTPMVQWQLIPDLLHLNWTTLCE